MGIPLPMGGIPAPMGGIPAPMGGIPAPMGGIPAPMGGIPLPMGGIPAPAGIPLPLGGIPAPAGISVPVGADALPGGGLGAEGGLGAGDLFPAATGVLELSPQPAMAKPHKMQTEVAINRRMGPPRERKLPQQRS
ncbi:MAG: hypothetical protein ACYC3X_21015 [Pirellulaceae bacterium]